MDLPSPDGQRRKDYELNPLIRSLSAVANLTTFFET